MQWMMPALRLRPRRHRLNLAARGLKEDRQATTILLRLHKNDEEVAAAAEVDQEVESRLQPTGQRTAGLREWSIAKSKKNLDEIFRQTARCETKCWYMNRFFEMLSEHGS